MKFRIGKDSRSLSPEMGSIWKIIMPSTALSTCFVILCIYKFFFFFDVTGFFGIYWSICLIRFSCNADAFIALSIHRICGWCQSSHMAHCIRCLGHLHTWVGIVLFRGSFSWYCHEQYCKVHVRNFTSHWSVIKGHLQSGGQVRLSACCYAIDKSLSRRNLILLHHYLRVRFLERQFEVITYEHIPREFNTIADSLANYVLDWHLSHSL